MSPEEEKLINTPVEETPGYDLFASVETTAKPKPKFLQVVRRVRLFITPYIVGFSIKFFKKAYEEMPSALVLYMLLKLYKSLMYFI